MNSGIIEQQGFVPNKIRSRTFLWVQSPKHISAHWRGPLEITVYFCSLNFLIWHIDGAGRGNHGAVRTPLPDDGSGALETDPIRRRLGCPSQLTIWRTCGDIPSFSGGEKVRAKKGLPPSTFPSCLCPVVVPGNRAPRSGCSSSWNRMHCRCGITVRTHKQCHCIGSVSARHFSLVGCAGPVLGGPIGGVSALFFLTQGVRSVVGLPSRWSVPHELLNEFHYFTEHDRIISPQFHHIYISHTSQHATATKKSKSQARTSARARMAWSTRPRTGPTTRSSP